MSKNKIGYVVVKAGLWTVDWLVDWTVDCDIWTDTHVDYFLPIAEVLLLFTHVAIGINIV